MSERKIIRRGDVFRSKYFSHEPILEFTGISGHWTGEDNVELYEPKSRQRYSLGPREFTKMMEVDNVEFVNV